MLTLITSKEFLLTVAALLSLLDVVSPCMLDMRLPLLFPGCNRSVVRRLGAEAAVFPVSLPVSLALDLFVALGALRLAVPSYKVNSELLKYSGEIASKYSMPLSLSTFSLSSFTLFVGMDWLDFWLS